MNPKLPYWHSLKTRVALLTLGVLVVSIWALTFFTSRVLRVDMQQQLGEQQFSTATLVAQGTEDELKARINALEQYAKGRLVPSMITDTAALQERLEGSPAILSMFNAGIFVTGVDGVAIASVPASLGRIGTNYMDRDFIVAAIREGRSTIGKPVIGKRMFSPILAMAVPVRDTQGTVIGALAGVTDLGHSNFLDRITQNRYGKSGGYLLIDSRHKLIVTATDKTRVMQPVPAAGLNAMHDQYMGGYEGFGVAVSSRGVQELSAARRIPVAGWFVVATLPTQEAFAPIEAMTQHVLLGSIVFSLVAGILTWLLITRMLRQQFAPMVSASRSLSALANSDRPVQGLPVTSQDEIGELIGSFNRLLEILGKRDEELRESHIRLRSVLDHSPALISIRDLNGAIILASQQFNLLDVPPLDELIGKSVFDLFPKDVAQVLWENDQAAVRADGPVDSEEVVRHRDGTLHTYLTLKFPVRDSTDKVFGICAISTDITERKQVEEKLKLAANVFTHAREGIIITDRDGTIVDINDTFTQITGYTQDEAIGKNPRILSSGVQGKEFYAAMWRDLIEKDHWYGEIWNRRKSGEIYAEMLTISAVRDSAGRTSHYVSLFSDITERKLIDDQMSTMAFHDPLTKLPNRRLIGDRLAQIMAVTKRTSCYGALMFLDLDNFKPLNDLHGHEIGDLLLIEVAERLKGCVREMDTVGRFGGDEFVVMLSELNSSRDSSIKQAGIVAEKIRAALEEPYILTTQQNGQAGRIVEHRCTTSVGVVLFINHESTQDEILKWADSAMYQAKAHGRNQVRFHDSAS